MNRNQFQIRKCVFYFNHVGRYRDHAHYMVTFSEKNWKVEVCGPDGRARTIEDLPEDRLRQFINETRAKEVLIAALLKKEIPIGVRPANRKSSRKVPKLRA